MGAGAVLQATLRTVVSQGLPAPAQRATVDALEAAYPGPLLYLYDAGRDAGLAVETVTDRLSAVFFNFASFNLSDDVSDGDCEYISDERLRPCVQLVLQSLFTKSILRLRLQQSTLDAVLNDLLQCEGAQCLEVVTDSWTVERYLEVADGIAGRQWSAYLRLLWDGTESFKVAESLALAIGRAALVAGDLQSNSHRMLRLSSSERKVLFAMAFEKIDGLVAEPYEFLRSVARDCKRALVTVQSDEPQLLR